MPSASSQPTATVGRVVDQIPRDGGHLLQPSWVNPDSHRGRFEQLAELFRGRSVLDVGCASGWKRPDWFHRLLAGVADELVGVDVDPVAVAAIADAGFDVRLADAETLDLGRRFDVVHAGEIIEHLDNPGGFLDAARRHLGPGGRLVVTTPNPFCVTNFVYRLGGRPRVNADHTCWYCEDTLSQLLVRHGFAVSEVRYLRHPTPGALRARLSGAVRALLPDRLAWNSLLVVARPVPGA